MRILALMTEAFGALGGIQKFNRDWLCALSGIDTVEEIDVLVRRQMPRPDLPAGISQRCPGFGKAGYVLTALERAMRLEPDDLVLCGHIHLAPLAVAITRISGSKSWLHLHGVEAWSGSGSAIRRSVTAVSLISIASRYTRGKFLGWSGFSPHRVKILPNLVDSKFTPGPVSEELKVELSLSNKKVLLTVGRLASDEAYKGQDRVIRALPEIASKVPEVVYLIIGEGNDKARLQQLAKEMSVESRVRFLGQVDNERLTALYRIANLFVMPSSGEGFGIVFLEAMACGCLALGLDAGGSVDALGSSELGHICTEENMVQMIVHALKSSSHAELYSKSAFSSEAFGRHVCALTRIALSQPTISH